MEGKTEKENKSVKKTACDVEALKKCLEENKGDYLKCQSHVEAFRSSCSINNSNSSSPKLNSGADSDPSLRNPDNSYC